MKMVKCLPGIFSVFLKIETFFPKLENQKLQTMQLEVKFSQ